jgi:hypothetical protein
LHDSHLESIDVEKAMGSEGGTFQEQLLASLDYLHKHVAAVAIFHLFEEGLYDELARGPSTSERLAQRLGLDTALLGHFLEYCRTEGILERDGDVFRLSAFGEMLGPYRGWFIFFVGGYGQTFHALGSCLRTGSLTPPRDFARVSRGSCEISRYGAFPLMRELMQLLPAPPRLLMDLGCGNGLYLTCLCGSMPGLCAVGIEPHQESHAAALAHIEDAGMAHRVRLLQADAITALRTYRGDEPDLILFAFILHEVLGQSGEQEVQDLLRNVARRFPRAHVIVIETDYVLHDKNLNALGIFKAYYNPYFLTQAFTAQKLQPRSYWKAQFEQAGFALVAEKNVSAMVDPSGLEVGFLLKVR